MTNAISKIAIGLVLCALMLGCETTGTKIMEGQTSIPNGKGLVLFSTDADEHNLFVPDVSLRLVDGASLKRFDKVIIAIGYPFNQDFPSERGHVETIALPEGEYFLLPNVMNPYTVTTKATVYKFNVINGRVTYIGNFHVSSLRLSWSTSKYVRDVSYFKQKNPGMVDFPIDRQDVEIAGDVSSFKTNGIIWGLP